MNIHAQPLNISEFKKKKEVDSVGSWQDNIKMHLKDTDCLIFRSALLKIPNTILNLLTYLLTPCAGYYLKS
jgi:hypothetical protein